MTPKVQWCTVHQVSRVLVAFPKQVRADYKVIAKALTRKGNALAKLDALRGRRRGLPEGPHRAQAPI